MEVVSGKCFVEVVVRQGCDEGYCGEEKNLGEFSDRGC